ncbi:hypothetical protein MMC19_005023 [Ptychographa xylographoides]|nr:hypothetical protein [Ptychographa xylographoides]
MYKKRFTKWSHDKNCKRKEMLAIIRKQTQRAKVGKASQFRFHGKPIEQWMIDRYFRRNPQSLAADALSAPTPPGLECLTAPTSPGLESSHIPSSPRTPDVFEIPERIFSCLRDYISGSFENGTWILNSTGTDLLTTIRRVGINQKLNALSYGSESAATLFAQKSYTEGGKTLRVAFAGIEDILIAERPDTLRTMFPGIFALQRTPEILLSLLRQCAKLARVVKPRSHPWVILFEHLSSLVSTDLEDILRRAWRAVNDQLEIYTQITNITVLHYLVGYYIQFDDVDGFKRLESILRDEVRSMDALHGPSRSPTIGLLVHQVELLLRQSKYAEAEETANDVLDRCSQNPNTFYYRAHCLCTIAYIQLKNGRIDLAESNMRQAIKLYVSYAGPNDPWVLGLFLKLEDWLRYWGKEESADEIQLERRRILFSTDV